MQEQQQFLTLPESLFETSAVADFTGEVSLCPITMGADTYTFAAPVRYRLFITNTGDALLVSGSVEGEARTQCARCLDTMELRINAEVEAYYLIPGEERPITEDEEVEYEVLEERNKIDLTVLCRAALALAFPYIPLCKEDCAGLCAQCGTNLNHGFCDCTTDEPITTNNPFAVLKDYPFGERT